MGTGQSRAIREQGMGELEDGRGHRSPATVPGSWASHPHSLGLSFPICKMMVIILHLPHGEVVRPSPDLGGQSRRTPKVLPESKVLLPQPESKTCLPFPHRASRDSEATRALCLFAVFQPPS